jgi:WD40 repeat protein
MLAALRNPSTQSRILSVAVCSDGMSLVVASRNHRATIWDRGTQKVRLVLTGHAAQINAVSFIGDGNRVVTASADGAVKLWSAEPVGQQGSSIVEPAGRSRLRTATFDAAGGLIATASQDGAVRLWDAHGARHAQLGPLPRMGRSSVSKASVAFSHDGAWLVTTENTGPTGHLFGRTEIWNVRTRSRP